MKDFRDLLNDAINSKSVSNEKTFEGKRLFSNISAKDFKEVFIHLCNSNLRKEHPEATFVIDNDNRMIINQLYYYIRGDEQFEGDLYKGIVLIGAYGSGKTTIMRTFADIMEALFQKRHLFISSYELLDLFTNKTQSIEYYERRPLVIDEMGREMAAIKNYGTERHPMTELITLRYNAHSLTYGTSNFKIESLRDKYGEYVGERLLQMCNFMVLQGLSRRK